MSATAASLGQPPIAQELGAALSPPPACSRSLALEPLTEADLELIAETDKRAYAHPWSLRQFRDSLAAGHASGLLSAALQRGDAPLRTTASGRLLLGYWIAMDILDEVHLLNLAVVPGHRRQGWGQTLMRTLIARSLQRHARSLWLEVRASNTAAQALYRRMGLTPIGRRKNYYPAAAGQREDALLMRLDLHAPLPPSAPTP